jgi:hypothetical protein
LTTIGRELRRRGHRATMFNILGVEVRAADLIEERLGTQGA